MCKNFVVEKDYIPEGNAVGENNISHHVSPA
jgi:hypothetical protein